VPENSANAERNLFFQDGFASLRVELGEHVIFPFQFIGFRNLLLMEPIEEDEKLTDGAPVLVDIDSASGCTVMVGVSMGVQRNEHYLRLFSPHIFLIATAIIDVVNHILFVHRRLVSSRGYIHQDIPWPFAPEDQWSYLRGLQARPELG
jgi:hypothetical protein